MMKICLSKVLEVIYFVGVTIFVCNNASAKEFADIHEQDFAIGIGTAYVYFDTKIKFTDKSTGRSVFLDPEGNLGLPERSSVTTFYGAYRFAKNHFLSFSYFGVKRESTLLNVNRNLDNLVIVDATASLTDSTNFYHLTYGYALFKDERSRILGLIGIDGLELKYVFEAQGQITYNGQTDSDEYKEDVSIFVPLPLFGLDLSFAFTKKWAIRTKISLIGGKYEDVRAAVLQSNINSLFQFTDHIGVTMGITHFNANVVIEDTFERQDIEYGYNGAYVGMHFSF